MAEQKWELGKIQIITNVKKYEKDSNNLAGMVGHDFDLHWSCQYADVCIEMLLAGKFEEENSCE